MDNEQKRLENSNARDRACPGLTPDWVLVRMVTNGREKTAG